MAPGQVPEQDAAYFWAWQAHALPADDAGGTLGLPVSREWTVAIPILSAVGKARCMGCLLGKGGVGAPPACR